MNFALHVCLVVTALTTFLASAQQPYDICDFPCVQQIYSDNCDGAICVFGYTVVGDEANVCSGTCIDALAGDEMLSCLQQNDLSREDFDEVLATKVEEIASYCANFPEPVVPPMVEPVVPPMVEPVVPPMVEPVDPVEPPTVDPVKPPIGAPYVPPTHPYDICDFTCVQKIYRDNCDGAFCVFGYNTVAQRQNICEEKCLDALAGDEMLLCLKKNDIKRKDFDAVLETKLGEITSYCSNFPSPTDPPMPIVDPPATGPMPDPPMDVVDPMEPMMVDESDSTLDLEEPPVDESMPAPPMVGPMKPVVDAPVPMPTAPVPTPGVPPEPMPTAPVPTPGVPPEPMPTAPVPTPEVPPEPMLAPPSPTVVTDVAVATAVAGGSADVGA